MTASIPAPIILIDGGDVTLYKSVAAAEADLEPWIADDTSITLADGNGRRLKMASEGLGIRIEVSEYGAVDDGDIRRLLGEALTAVGSPAPGDVTLRDLIERAYDAGFGHPE